MKVWLKLLMGSVLGVLLGGLLPSGNQELSDVLVWLSELAIKVGRYAVVPIILCSLTLAVYELRQNGGFWPLVFRSVLVMLASSVFVIGVGLLVISFFPTIRIPISTDEQFQAVSLDLRENINLLFPSNMFAALVTDGVYLLPVCVFAFFVGMGLSFDRSFSKPIIALIDSFSRIFYYIGAFFSEILGLVIIVLSAYWAVQYNEVIKDSRFLSLIGLTGVLSLVLGLLLLPFLLYLLQGKKVSFVALYSSLAAAMTAFFSGDINFTLPVLIQHAKENLGVRRRVIAVTMPLFTTFGRAGSAMVAAVAFVVITKSYSSLEITRTVMVSIGVQALFISFILARYPGSGAYIALIALCQNFDNDVTASGYLILKPLAFYLIALGTFLDTMLAFFATYAIGKMTGLQEDRNDKNFI
ncbi:MAG: cation:dicarboxylase symporter family transporter [Treponema sp.]|jgi:Na+/H+-dicarboxylate symporter|nr:cation:dicarboxylase symporter family transporter [Treponema sp.]